MRRRRRTTPAPPGPAPIEMLKAPFVPTGADFKPHSWVPCTGWSYALHPVDKIDDPFRRRVTMKSPTGETFRGWIAAGEPTGARAKAIAEMGPEWNEAADVALLIRDAELFIQKREAPHLALENRAQRRYA